MAKKYLDSSGKWSAVESSNARPASELSGSTVEDPTASTGKVVQVPSDTADTDVSSQEYAYPFGLYSVIIRAKTTVNSGANVLLNVVAYAGDTKLADYPIKESDFSAANAWVSLGLGVDYKGNKGQKLKVVLHRGTYSGTAVLSIDYVQVMPAPVAINALT